MELHHKITFTSFGHRHNNDLLHVTEQSGGHTEGLLKLWKVQYFVFKDFAIAKYHIALNIGKGPLSDLVFNPASVLQEVVASGTPCPSPLVLPEKWNDQVMLTQRNLQASRILLSSVCAHASTLDDLWYFCLLTCQHIAWLLAMRPSSVGTFLCERSEIDQQSKCGNVISSAALAEIPTLAALFDKIPCVSVSLTDGSLLMALNALTRLSDENIAVAATGRECSLFPVAMLLRFCSLNLHRQQICGHTTPFLRDWAAVALSSMIKQAFKTKTSISEMEHQFQTLNTLQLMCSIHQSDVQRRQLDCLMTLLQTDGSQLKPDIWQHVIHMIAVVVDEESCYQVVN
ncbi:hypothetical protein DICVIV_11379 [Dictyocaulus viviparus]|uniref:Uncharacterized protein n=1 Tax=Dictyocaulus viviparus TaxID=29172 RepID=A0A0D8XDC3_DICVI|nr:hypothetical protein DICVIV_11379 [Dictyocaulus viviparus]